MSAYLTKTEARTYRAMQAVLIGVGVYAAFTVATAKADTLTIKVQPPTVLGIEKPPVADYTVPNRINVRNGAALVIDLMEPAPDNGCNGRFLDVHTGRCFGRVIMR